jgi:hypothetical protein
MKAAFVLILGILMGTLLAVPNIQAHSPTMAGDNESLATATVINDPTKSWAVYAELHEGGEAQYYKFDISAGQTIYAQLFISTDSAYGNFTPSLVLMGPGVQTNGTVPGYVEQPNGSTALIIQGVQPPAATYEPFTPSSFIQLAEVRMAAPNSSTYYVAVFEPSRGGHYGLAIGERESFTLEEWLLMPFHLIGVHQWEGQSLFGILGPMVVTVIVGLLFILWRLRPWKSLTPFDWAGIMAGLLFLGSSAVVFTQMAIAISHTSLQGMVGVSLMFALIPLILSLVTIRVVLKRDSRPNARTRIYMMILGIFSLVFWAGLVIGSVFAFLAAVMPLRRAETQSIEVKAEA